MTMSRMQCGAQQGGADEDDNDHDDTDNDDNDDKEGDKEDDDDDNSEDVVWGGAGRGKQGNRTMLTCRLFPSSYSQMRYKYTFESHMFGIRRYVSMSLQTIDISIAIAPSLTLFTIHCHHVMITITITR